METKVKIAENIKHLRETKGLTQVELGEKIAVNQNTISYYEKGERSPALDKLMLLADFFGVPMEILIFKDFKKKGTEFMNISKETLELEEICKEMDITISGEKITSNEAKLISKYIQFTRENKECFL